MGNVPGSNGVDDNVTFTGFSMTTTENHDDRFESEYDAERTLCGASQQIKCDYDRKCLTPLSIPCSLQRPTSTIDVLETPPSSNESEFFTPNSGFVTAASSISNEFYEDESSENLNEIADHPTSNYSYFQTPILNIIRSDAIRKLRRRSLSSSNNLLQKLQNLSKLTVSQRDHINIEATVVNNNCSCDANSTDENCLKSFMEMSVTPAEFRNNNQMLTSTPIMSPPIIGKDVIDYDHGIFSIARVKKVELHDLSPKVSEFNGTETTLTNRCNGNNKNTKVINGNQLLPKTYTQTEPITPMQCQQPKLQQPQQLQHQLNTMPSSTPEDGNVLKKIISISVEQFNNTEHSASKSVAATRPTFVPEKLNFSAYERFEGQMLINWILSTVTKQNSLNDRDTNDICLLASHFCTNLFIAGVMKQIIDKNVPLQDSFCPNLMYRWTYTEPPPFETPVYTPKTFDAENIWSQFDRLSSSLNENTIRSVNGENTPLLCSDIEKLITIKSKFTKCCTITTLYAEIKRALSEIEEYAQCNRISLQACTLEKSKSVDCVDHAAVFLKIEPQPTDHIVEDNKEEDKEENCDIIENVINGNLNKISCKNQSTQTEQVESNEKVLQEQKAKVQHRNAVNDKLTANIPAPPPLPPWFAVPTATSNKNQIPPPPPPMPLHFSAQTLVNQNSSSASIPPPPPMPLNFSAQTLVNQNLSSASIPPPPPMPLNFSAQTSVNQISSSASIPPPPPPMPIIGIPNPPPFPIQPTVLSSSSSGFCVPPPPPMSNGMSCPPPLPMPSAGNVWFKTDTFRKCALTPPKPMRPLYWTRIVAPKEQTQQLQPTEEEAESISTPVELWQEIDETKLDNLDEFTELFSRQTVVPKKVKEPAKTIKIKCVKVLDCKRSQSVGIFARSLHFDFGSIERAIYHWDTSKISLEILQQLLEHKASPQELEMINDAMTAQSDTPLDGPEQFLLKMSKISCSAERISCIIFQAEFDEACNFISKKVETVRKLCEFLIENEHLKALFSIILTLGNYMNGGNRMRGQADGFGLEILSKLRDVKSKDSKVTLLHFIVKTYINKYRQDGVALHEIVFPIPDVTDINRTLAIDFIEVKDQVDDLNKKLSEFEKKMEKVIGMSNAENLQPFKERSEAFVKSASKSIDAQNDELCESKLIFQKTLKFYKFIPKSGTLDECTPGQFFELWSSFANDFRDIWKKEFIAINYEIVQKAKSIVSAKALHDKSISRGKIKSSGLRMRRLNQI